MTGWPFSGPSSSEASSSGRGALRFTQHHVRATSEALMEQLGAMQHVGKQAFEVAVKRNGMTTSLFLLSSILVADYFILGPTKSRRERLQLAQNHRGATSLPMQQQQAQQQQQQQYGSHGGA